MKRVWKVLLCVAIISSMLLTSVFAANYSYPGVNLPVQKRDDIHWVDLGEVENARDLGGYVATVNGNTYTIKNNMLFRSGHLKNADSAKINDKQIKKVIDLRTKVEALSKPDIKVEGVTRVSISPLTIPYIFAMESDDWKSLFNAIASGVMEVWDTNLYRQYIQDPQAIKATQEFFAEVVESAKNEEVVLWHCTAGKDRTGIEAMLLMAALGCDYNTILDEFLQTNFYYKDKAEESYRKAYDITHIKAIAKEFYNYEIVKTSWLEGISMDVMQRKAGGKDFNETLQAYLTNVIKLSDSDREILRKAYLDGYAQVEDTESENAQTFESLSDVA